MEEGFAVSENEFTIGQLYRFAAVSPKFCTGFRSAGSWNPSDLRVPIPSGSELTFLCGPEVQ
jgi:hypothetical protein